jgi:hypothetical protein
MGSFYMPWRGTGEQGAMTASDLPWIQQRSAIDTIGKQVQLAIFWPSRLLKKQICPG